ncbi:hypothetical protein [Nocardia xishanensis]|uniref:hypothetical protein n=1 Tax=Nocardia xishanensis TaxID=238964 RepID=UPI0012F4E3CA|nr:hypothetical protein [Nocardia xishanensis]
MVHRRFSNSGGTSSAVQPARVAAICRAIVTTSRQALDTSMDVHTILVAIHAESSRTL